MAFARTLLERLESPSVEADRSISRDPEQTKASIQLHLQRMLNSRHGSAPAVPDFGTADFSSYFEGLESVGVFEREIREAIERHEPRLADVQVRFVRNNDLDVLQLNFEIEARVVDDDGDLPVFFRTVLEGGELKVYR